VIRYSWARPFALENSRPADWSPEDAVLHRGVSDGSVLSPDASWVRRDRWDALDPREQESFPPFCPDAVFEIRSRSDNVQELRAKMLAYAENGARLGVLFDPYDNFVELYRPNAAAERVDGLRVTLDPELPRLVVDISRV
jgi:Uma2 family endonuclease